MQAHTLFISDLHLNAQRPDITAAFVRFCEQRASQAEALYILGDLSDAWLGDDDDSEIAAILREQVSQLAKHGVSVFIMTGNRDFLMGQQFAHDCQCQLLDDPSVIELYGQRVLLMHGDSMCTGDSEYMAFREQIRNPDMQQLLLAKSLDERRDIAAMLRAQSQSANAVKAADIMDVTQSEVEQALRDHHVSTLIHGHTHRPNKHSFNMVDARQQSITAYRYVLGDWDTHGWCINASHGSLKLESFPL